MGRARRRQRRQACRARGRCDLGPARRACACEVRPAPVGELGSNSSVTSVRPGEGRARARSCCSRRACQSRGSLARPAPSPEREQGALAYLAKRRFPEARPTRWSPACGRATRLAVTYDPSGSGLYGSPEILADRGELVDLQQNATALLELDVTAAVRIGRDFFGRPRSSCTAVLDDRRLQRVDQRAAQLARQRDEQLLVDEVALAAVRQQEPRRRSGASGPPSRCRTPDGRTEASRPQHAPHLAHHRREVCVVSAKCRTALLSTTSAKPSGNDISSTGSARKFSRVSRGASWRTMARTEASRGIGSTPKTSKPSGRSRPGCGRRRTRRRRRACPARCARGGSGRRGRCRSDRTARRDQTFASVRSRLNPAHPRKGIPVASALRLVASRNRGRFGRVRRRFLVRAQTERPLVGGMPTAAIESLLVHRFADQRFDGAFCAITYPCSGFHFTMR